MLSFENEGPAATAVSGLLDKRKMPLPQRVCSKYPVTSTWPCHFLPISELAAKLPGWAALGYARAHRDRAIPNHRRFPSHLSAPGACFSGGQLALDFRHRCLASGLIHPCAVLRLAAGHNGGRPVPEDPASLVGVASVRPHDCGKW